VSQKVRHGPDKSDERTEVTELHASARVLELRLLDPYSMDYSIFKALNFNMDGIEAALIYAWNEESPSTARSSWSRYTRATTVTDTPKLTMGQRQSYAFYGSGGC
jgi:hypothetical protein